MGSGRRDSPSQRTNEWELEGEGEDADGGQCQRGPGEKVATFYISCGQPGSAGNDGPSPWEGSRNGGEGCSRALDSFGEPGGCSGGGLSRASPLPRGPGAEDSGL